jgi:hypothetical protein
VILQIGSIEGFVSFSVSKPFTEDETFSSVNNSPWAQF